jgi:fructokinase
MSRIDESRRPVVVGEVLFDVFPDGRRVLGGAPFNVAWNLQAFGQRPLLVTRIGADENGEAVIAAMTEWGMETSAVQRDGSRPTGQVRVSDSAGEPAFEIVPDQAYDFLDAGDALASVSRVAASTLYHGSLILRSDHASDALKTAREHNEAPVFVDVNLRDPWWRRAEVLEIAGRATWVKLNEAELASLSNRPLEEVANAPEAAAEGFRARLGVSMVIVTRGPAGALLADDHGVVSGRPPETAGVVDTVGAGDAFSSVMILGLTSGWPGEVILERALAFASTICTIRGATTRDRGFYSEWNGLWEGGER